MNTYSPIPILHCGLFYNPSVHKGNPHSGIEKGNNKQYGKLWEDDHKSDISLQQLNLFSRNTMNHGRLNIWDRCQHLHLLFINGLAAMSAQYR